MARAATGARFPGAAAAAMARLADYFIVVGYDHEKSGKGVGRAPPPALPAPGRCPVGSTGPGVAAGGRRGAEGPAPWWRVAGGRPAFVAELNVALGVRDPRDGAG